MKKTKIICTIGPSSTDPQILEKMIQAGMNIARLNFSHGTYEEHAERIRLIRETAARLGVTVGILADIQGPKIRIGKLKTEPLLLKEGDRLHLTTDPAKDKTEGFIYVDYPTLLQDVKVGSKILLADGMINLSVVALKDVQVECQVLNSGELTSRKGVTLPGVSVNLPALMGKDPADIEFVVKQQVDFIAVSFARKAEHLLEIRRLVKELGGQQLLIAKIENEEGFRNSEEILQACDGIMVARGDLGVEVPLEEVPIIQKTLIDLCNSTGKPVITATEMLESMIRNPRPTRAEVTDITHAILDGTDAIMLSAETAAGKYPIEAVEMMAKTAQRIENSLRYDQLLDQKKVGIFPTVADAISHATCQTALDLKATAIISSTQSGSTARTVSKYRPQAPIVAVTPSQKVAQQLTISWGVYPLIVPAAKDIDSMLDGSVEAAKKNGFIKEDDLIVLTAGVRTNEPGSTNLLQVYQVS